MRNCSSALCSMGPRQITGWSSLAKNPMEIARTPWTSGGINMSSITTGARSMPSIRGMENPHTSASMIAVLLPRLANAMARLLVIEDLPTPPLPDAMSRTRVFEAGSANGISRPSAWPCEG